MSWDVSWDKGLSELKPGRLVTRVRNMGDDAGAVGGAECTEKGRGGGASGVTCGSRPTQSHDPGYSPS